VLEKISYSLERYIENISYNSVNLSLNSFLPNLNIRDFFDSYSLSIINSNIPLNSQYLPNFDADRLRHVFEPIINNTFYPNNITLPNPRLYYFSNVSFHTFICNKKIIFILVSLSLLFVSSLVLVLYEIIYSIINGIQAYIKKLADNSRSAGFRGFKHTMTEQKRNQYQTQGAYFPGV
jgi:hypothetical protein